MPKRTLIINKLKKPLKIPCLKQKQNTLFQDPENYLKLPYETDFNFVVGQKPKGPRFNSDHKLIPYSIVGTILRRDQRKQTRKQTVQNSWNSSKSVRKSMRLTKIKLPMDSTQKDDKKKRRQYITNITHSEVFDIFDNYKKLIDKNKTQILGNNSILYKDVPKTMHQYINEPIYQQERTLKSSEKYNNLVTKIENNIFRVMQNKNKTKRNYNEFKFSNTNDSRNLIKNSGIEYRMKIEKINSEEKDKNPRLVLNNHIQNWEMSLRRPRNFMGERKEYINFKTDKNPYWLVLTEKNPIENEKIVNPLLDYSIINKKIKLKNLSYINEKPNNLTSNGNASTDFNYLEIKGNKLIDIEEKIANQMKGNIKLFDLRYDREFTKDLLIKSDYTINKHSINKSSLKKDF
jgi:hypothetical protein